MNSNLLVSQLGTLSTLTTSAQAASVSRFAYGDTGMERSGSVFKPGLLAEVLRFKSFDDDWLETQTIIVVTMKL